MTQKSTSGRIPVVDFRAFNITHEEIPPATDPAVQELVQHLYSACSTIGFVCLTNHGILQEEIDNVLQTVERFFAFEPNVKESYRKLPGALAGWDKLESQILNRSRPADLKESFDISRRAPKDFKYPDDLIPDFKSTVETFYGHLRQLGLRVLSALAIGLDVKPEVMTSPHVESDDIILQFNYYPKITNTLEVKSGQIRCGEHSDYGTITLLIQDDAGGLEIATQDGEFIPVTPIPGTVLVNIGDLMKRWTSDRFKSVVHRVMIPKEQSKRDKSRLSIAFFLDPKNDAIISCLDGSDMYPPLKAGDYIEGLIKKSYT